MTTSTGFRATRKIRKVRPKPRPGFLWVRHVSGRLVLRRDRRAGIRRRHDKR